MTVDNETAVRAATSSQKPRTWHDVTSPFARRGLCGAPLKMWTMRIVDLNEGRADHCVVCAHILRAPHDR